MSSKAQCLRRHRFWCRHQRRRRCVMTGHLWVTTSQTVATQQQVLVQQWKGFLLWNNNYKWPKTCGKLFKDQPWVRYSIVIHWDKIIRFQLREMLIKLVCQYILLWTILLNTRCFCSIFWGKRGLAGCPIDSQSPLIAILTIIVRRLKLFLDASLLCPLCLKKRLISHVVQHNIRSGFWLYKQMRLGGSFLFINVCLQ